MNRAKEIKTIETIYKYHSEFVDFTICPKERKIRISNGGDDIVISLEKLKEINRVIKEMGV